jgi:hypothetical protein
MLRLATKGSATPLPLVPTMRKRMPRRPAWSRSRSDNRWCQGRSPGWPVFRHRSDRRAGRVLAAPQSPVDLVELAEQDRDVLLHDGQSRRLALPGAAVLLAGDPVQELGVPAQGGQRGPKVAALPRRRRSSRWSRTGAGMT